jgi:hypothetical protein
MCIGLSGILKKGMQIGENTEEKEEYDLKGKAKIGGN